MTSLIGQQQADREMGQTDKQAKQTGKQINRQTNRNQNTALHFPPRTWPE